MEHTPIIFPFSAIDYYSTPTFETTVVKRPGVGPKILLIHGIACTKEIFFLYPLIFPMSDFIAYDLRGFGTGIAKDGKYDFDSYVSDAMDIVKRYSPDIILGHSYGGAIAQAVGYRTGLPTITLQTSPTPPPTVSKESYLKTMSVQINNAFVDTFLDYLFVPGAIPMYIQLMAYNPDMPAMDHMNELTDFKTLCPLDSKTNIMKIMGGTKDPIVSEKEVKELGKCAGKPVYFFNVNHVGILYPNFVQFSLSTIGAR